MINKILIIAAHPDDEILGCGGTIIRLSREGNDVYTLILGEGVTSRIRNRREAAKKINRLRNEARKANRILGVKKVFFEDFPDNGFDKVPLLNIVKKIENVKKRIKPTVVLTHHRADLNIDHKITYDAVLTSFRPIKGETVREIYSFEILSSTEWNYPKTFDPNVYIDISDSVIDKIKSMKAYIGEIRLWPHPRSPEAIENLAKKRGSEAGLEYAEAFELIRQVRL